MDVAGERVDSDRADDQRIADERGQHSAAGLGDAVVVRSSCSPTACASGSRTARPCRPSSACSASRAVSRASGWCGPCCRAVTPTLAIEQTGADVTTTIELVSPVVARAARPESRGTAAGPGSPNTGGTIHDENDGTRNGTMNSNEKVTILVVDDDRLVLATLTHGLSQAGYRVIDADNGDDAILLAREHQPALALLDIRMQGKSGFDVAAYLHEYHQIPFIFLSAFSDEATLARGRSLGAAASLTKPLDIGQILPVVEAVLSRTRQPDAAAGDVAHAEPQPAVVWMAIGALMHRHFDRSQRGAATAAPPGIQREATAARAGRARARSGRGARVAGRPVERGLVSGRPAAA